MELSRDSKKMLKYLRSHGETEIQSLCWESLGRKLCSKDPYLFEELSHLVDVNLIYAHREESKSPNDFLTMIRLTPYGKSFMDETKRRTKEYWFNETRAWITAVIALAGFVASVIALR